MDSYIIIGPKIYTEHAVLENHQLVVHAGIIQSIVAQGYAVPFGLPVFEFPSSYHLIPGMIDLHIHGAAGSDVMDATPAALRTISAALIREGVTGFLATTMTEKPAHIERALQAVAEFCEIPALGAQILGIHLEGPFLSKQQMGAQCGEWIQDPDIALFDHWQRLAKGRIKQVTVAPEQPQALAFIRHLRSQGVIASIGHTDASYAQTCAAIEAGATQATHLFNAMRGLHHRAPGAVTALLLDDRIATELIVDGVHLDPAIVKLTLKVKGKDRILLVSDAMRAKCCGEGVFDLGGQAVSVKNGEARLANGTLAGSVLTLHQGLTNLLRYTGCSLSAAVAMTSTNPARQLGLTDRGTIAVGKRADLVVLNDHYELIQTLGVF